MGRTKQAMREAEDGAVRVVVLVGIREGGRRCQREGCAMSALGSTHFCKTHGGGKPCEQVWLDTGMRVPRNIG